MDNLTGLRLVAEKSSLADRGVDIITIHGLEGYNSWTYTTNQSGEGSESVFWVRDFLPTDHPSARVFTYSWRSSALCDDQGITETAYKLLEKLKNLQADNIEQESRPFVFICHSLGGLILQCALNVAFDNREVKALNKIIEATRGIIFLGTPHSSPFRDLHTSISRIAAANNSPEVTMTAIQLIWQILARFAGLPQHDLPWRVVHCYEELPLPGTDFRAVNPNRGELWTLPQVSLYNNHLDLCRFTSKHDPSYLKVLQSLRNITSGSSGAAADEIEVYTTLSPVEDEVLESLQTEDVSADVRDASQDTCDWIFEHDTYKFWLETPSRPLWITGKPGSGKSTMMKYIIDHYRQERASSRTVVSFFFSHHGTNQSIKSLLSSLLHQLLRTAPSTRTFEIFSRFLEWRELEGFDNAWDNDILTENLLKLVDKSTALGDSFFCFIDGLDECDDPDMVVALLQRLNAFSPSRQIWICVSSRPSDSFTPKAEIRMEDNNSFDIRKFFCDRLLTMEIHLPPTLDFEQITQNLLEKAQGVFVWVSLMVSHLRCDGYLKASETEQHLTPWLPTSLDAAYERILARVWNWHDGSHRQLAQDALILVLCAQRPLSILELRSALAETHSDLDLLAPASKLGIDRSVAWNEIRRTQGRAPLDTTAQLMILCGGLLEVTPWPSGSTGDMASATESTVRLVHYTAKEYLMSDRFYAMENSKWNPKVSYSPVSQESQELPLSERQSRKDPNAQYHIRTAWICLLYVDRTRTRSNLPKFKSTTSSAPFLGYSLSFGMLHLSLAERKGVTPMTENMLQFSPFQKGFIDHWSLLHSQMFKDQKLFEPRETGPVHIMSFYGFPWYNSGLWGVRITDINKEDRHGRTSLSLAAAMGHVEICDLLLREGADISHRDHVYGQTPLSFAAAHGHRGVVELLLSKGSDYDDHISGSTPLWVAIQSGHLGVVELLLKAGANPNATSIHTGETCLSRAAALGHIRAAHLLLERGAGVDTWDKNGWTPLHHAISRGRKKTIEVLLGHLKSHQLQRLKANFSNAKAKGSWINTVFSAIILWACCQRGNGSQTPPTGNPNTQASRVVSCDQVSTRPRRNRHKHKLTAESDEDGCEEDDSGIPGKRPRHPIPNQRRLACPYHKRNEAKFSSGACNGKGFEDISRLKTHLKKYHDRAKGWTRCQTCQKRFLRDKFEDHRPCEARMSPTDYEDGYDKNQAEDLESKNTRRRNNPDDGACWREIFKVLFPDWPETRGIPSPYQETQIQDVPGHLAQAVQQLRNRAMDPNTISRIRACQDENGIRQILGQLFGGWESHSELPPTVTGNLPPGPMSIASSQQPTVDTLDLDPLQYMPLPARPLFEPTRSYNYGRHSDSAVSSSYANSSQFFPIHDHSDMFTEDTAPSDQMSIGFGPFGTYHGPDGNSNLSQLPQWMAPPPVPQQPTNNMDYNLGSSFPIGNQGTNSANVLVGFRHGSQHRLQSTREEFVLHNPHPEGCDEEQQPEPGF